MVNQNLVLLKGNQQKFVWLTVIFYKLPILIKYPYFPIHKHSFSIHQYTISKLKFSKYQKQHKNQFTTQHFKPCVLLLPILIFNLVCNLESSSSHTTYFIFTPMGKVRKDEYLVYELIYYLSYYHIINKSNIFHK